MFGGVCVCGQDALVLQRVCLEKKAELCVDEGGNEEPDVQGLVQTLMVNLFVSMYNHSVSSPRHGQALCDHVQPLGELSQTWSSSLSPCTTTR